DRLGRRLLVAVGADHQRALAGRPHGDGPAVADRRVGVLARLGAGTDDEHGAVGQPARGGGGAHLDTPVAAATSSSTCTPRLFRAKATMWEWPASIGTSIIWRSS